MKKLFAGFADLFGRQESVTREQRDPQARMFTMRWPTNIGKEMARERTLQQFHITCGAMGLKAGNTLLFGVTEEEEGTYLLWISATVGPRGGGPRVIGHAGVQDDTRNMGGVYADGRLRGISQRPAGTPWRHSRATDIVDTYLDGRQRGKQSIEGFTGNVSDVQGSLGQGRQSVAPTDAPDSH